MELRIVSAVSAAVLASALAGPVFAQGGPDQMRVQVGDLNLSSSTGAQTAFNRIRVATRGFCSVDPGSRQLAAQAEARRCDAQMTYLAVKKLDAPMVTAAYEGSRAGQPPVLLAQR